MTATPKREQDPEYLSTLERGLSVLRAFNHSRPEMQLSEVALATIVAPSALRSSEGGTETEVAAEGEGE